MHFTFHAHYGSFKVVACGFEPDVDRKSSKEFVLGLFGTMFILWQTGGWTFANVHDDDGEVELNEKHRDGGWELARMLQEMHTRLHGIYRGDVVTEITDAFREEFEKRKQEMLRKEALHKKKVKEHYRRAFQSEPYVHALCYLAPDGEVCRVRAFAEQDDRFLATQKAERDGVSVYHEDHIKLEIPEEE